MNRSPWTCPDASCGAQNPWTMAQCEVCGVDRPTGQPAAPGREKHDAWQCDACPTRTPGTIFEDGRRLCPSCRVELVLKPRASRPHDRCTEPDCPNTEPHTIQWHIDSVKADLARMAARFNPVTL